MSLIFRQDHVPLCPVDIQGISLGQSVVRAVAKRDKHSQAASAIVYLPDEVLTKTLLFYNENSSNFVTNILL